MRGNRLALAVLAIAVTAVACGSSAANDGIASAAGTAEAPGPTVSRDFQGEMRAWAQCMRDNGFDMPDPDPATGKFTNFDWPQKGTPEATTYDQAAGACKELETFNEDSGRKPLTAKELDLWRQWAQCMRDNGVDMPDPEPDGPPELGRGSGVSRADMERAEEACFDQFMAARMAGR